VSWKGRGKFVTSQSDAASGSFLFRFWQADPSTHRSDVERLRRFAQQLGVTLKELQATRPNHSALKRWIRGDYGTAVTRVELEFSLEGIRNISQASKGDVLIACRDAVRALGAEWDERSQGAAQRLVSQIRAGTSLESSWVSSVPSMGVKQGLNPWVHVLALVRLARASEVHLNRISIHGGQVDVSGSSPPSGPSLVIASRVP
jgi:hypothetical protein